MFIGQRLCSFAIYFKVICLQTLNLHLSGLETSSLGKVQEDLPDVLMGLLGRILILINTKNPPIKQRFINKSWAAQRV
jgi:hypothetical protein